VSATERVKVLQRSFVGMSWNVPFPDIKLPTRIEEVESGSVRDLLVTAAGGTVEDVKMDADGVNVGDELQEEELEADERSFYVNGRGERVKWNRPQKINANLVAAPYVMRW
jgi:hypothetical protein